jgi:flagellar biosynthesis/type III secretory pathway protein FliH
VYTIVVLTSGDKHQQDVLISDFTPKTLKGQPVSEIEHKLIFLCPKYVTEETPEPYRTWLRAINDTLDEQVDETQYDNEIIQRMFEHIEQDSVTPQERARMFDEYGQEQLRRDEYKLGVAEGEAKGKAEGKIEALLTVARQLLDLLDDATISQKTGLPLETIRSLR